MKLTDQALYKSVVNTSHRYSLVKARLGMVKEVEEAIEPIEVGPNDLVLGCSGPEFSRDNLVKINMKRFGEGGVGEKFTWTGAIVGIQGSGKTQMAREVICANFATRFKEHFFIYDPKGEWWSIAEPSYEQPGEKAVREKVDAMYSSLAIPGLHRQGYKVVTISPLFLGTDRKNVDIFFSISWQNVRDVYDRTPDEAIKMLVELLGITGGVERIEKMIDFISYVMLDRKISSWKGFRLRIRELSVKWGETAGSLLRKYRLRKEQKVISDNPKYHIDILRLMVDYQGVLYRGKLKTTPNAYVDLPFNACLKIIGSLILNDMFRYNVDKDSGAVMKLTEIAVGFDEIDLIASEVEDSSTREWVLSFAAKARMAGIDLTIIGQEASLIYNELFTQCKVIMTSIVTENNAKILAKAHIPKEYLNMEGGLLSTLKRKQKTSVETEQDEWAVKDEEGNVETFYAFPMVCRGVRR